MGLFSSKTKVYVASSAYNMAGDEDLRPNILRSVILGGVLMGGKRGLGEHLQLSIMNGPAAHRKAFFRWAREHYVFGMPTATVGVNLPVDKDKAYAGLRPLLSLGSNQHLRILSALVDDPDIHYWAERWVMENHPGIQDDAWEAEWDGLEREILVTVGDLPAVRLAAPADLIWGVTTPGRKLLYLLYEVVTQDPFSRVVTVSEPRLFSYQMGSGNVVFDSLDVPSEPEAEFFPVIPLRMDKKWITNPEHKKHLPGVKKAYSKLVGSKLKDLLNQLKETDSIENVDSVYITQGVSLNTKENIGREYIYRFLKKLSEKELKNKIEFPLVEPTPPREELDSVLKWNRWTKTHKENKTTSPVFDTPAPSFWSAFFSNDPTYSLKVRSDDLTKADFRLGWESIKETNHVGNAKTWDGKATRRKAKVGEYWFDVGPSVYVRRAYKGWGDNDTVKYRNIEHQQVYLFHQYARRRYRRLACVGLTHKNFVYKTHAVEISAKDALQETEEDSGFIVPMHMPTLKELGMVKANQLSTCSCYLVFNSYKKVKRKWYQRGFFRLVLAIATIAISFITSGASLATMGGILGQNAAIGAALGATAASAALVGAIANGIAAMVVTTIISKGATKLFGEKIGAIVGTIASFVALTYGTQFAMHGNFAVNWGQMFRAENLMKLTDSVTRAYSMWLNADTMGIYAEMENLGEEYAQEMERIQELSKDILGMTSGEIDPMMLVDASEHFGESSELFLSRTLLTGSDIAELTFAMVENFADISLELPGSSSQA